jgi:hypothetical protein
MCKARILSGRALPAQKSTRWPHPMTLIRKVEQTLTARSDAASIEGVFNTYPFFSQA